MLFDSWKTGYDVGYEDGYGEATDYLRYAQDSKNKE